MALIRFSVGRDTSQAMCPASWPIARTEPHIWNWKLTDLVLSKQLPELRAHNRFLLLYYAAGYVILFVMKMFIKKGL